MDKGYREVAVMSLKRILKDKAYSNIVIMDDIKRVDSKYFNIYRKVVLGTVENIIFIDYVINMISKTKTGRMEDDVLMALRLAVYQIFFLDHSRPDVVVNESVQYIKKRCGQRAAGFVNGVLRTVLRSKGEMLNHIDSLQGVEHLSIKYSYPVELVQLWINQFGNENIESVLCANNKEAPLEVRANTLKISKEELINVLYNKGIRARSCKFADKGIIIDNPSEIEKTEEYRDGLFSIQSESSMLAGQVLAPAENSVIIDLCAAPGGKSFNAAEMMNNTGMVCCRDIHEHKMMLMNREVARLGLKNIKTEVYDSTLPDDSLKESADYCIVDVPCTGLGIIRRKPEIKYNFKQKNIESLNEIQYKILKNAAGYLKPGGSLVYSTCTINQEENLSLIRRFLHSDGRFVMDDISGLIGAFDTAKDGYLEIYPHVHDMDGFFIAKLKKI